MEDWQQEKTGKDIYSQLSEKDLNRSLFLSQLLLLAIGLILGQLLFSDDQWFFSMLQWDASAILLGGGACGVLIVGLQIFLSETLPKHWMEDDGLNILLFRNKTLFSVFWIVLCIACVEEFLFRGVLQTRFGFWIAVVIFTFAHMRYFKRPLLLGILIFTSALLGLLFAWTKSLWAVIFAHFIIDFVLILYMKKEERMGRS